MIMSVLMLTTEVKPYIKSMKLIDVAIAVIQQHNNPEIVLIAKRPDDVHLGGLWEFPGGKVEPGESGKQAMIREVKEELGIDVLRSDLLKKIEHTYTDRKVSLSVYLVSRYEGDVTANESQQIRWVNKENLHDYAFPEANQAILNALLEDH